MYHVLFSLLSGPMSLGTFGGTDLGTRNIVLLVNNLSSFVGKQLILLSCNNLSSSQDKGAKSTSFKKVCGWYLI